MFFVGPFDWTSFTLPPINMEPDVWGKTLQTRTPDRSMLFGSSRGLGRIAQIPKTSFKCGSRLKS